MPVTKRLYEKNQTALNVQPSPSVTPTPSLTPTITPSISVSPIPVSVTPTVTPSPSIAYYYLANMYTCYQAYGQLNCGNFIGQSIIYNGITAFTLGSYYASGSNPGRIVYQPLYPVAPTGNVIYVNSFVSGSSSCTSACNDATHP